MGILCIGLGVFLFFPEVGKKFSLKVGGGAIPVGEGGVPRVYVAVCLPSCAC